MFHKIKNINEKTEVIKIKHIKSKVYLEVSNGETDIENRLMDMGRGEDRVRCMETVTWKLILPHVK